MHVERSLLLCEDDVFDVLHVRGWWQHLGLEVRLYDGGDGAPWSLCVCRKGRIGKAAEADVPVDTDHKSVSE